MYKITNWRVDHVTSASALQGILTTLTSLNYEVYRIDFWVNESETSHIEKVGAASHISRKVTDTRHMAGVPQWIVTSYMAHQVP